MVAALITPAAADRFGTTTWITSMLVMAGAVIAAFGLPFQRDLLVVGSFFLGISAQSVKICVDSTVQQQVDDVYRGRVFSVYDMAFNVTYVGAAAVAATVLPKSGKSFVVMACLACGYLLAAMIFAWLSVGTSTPPPEAPTQADTPPGVPRQPVGIEIGKSSSGGSPGRNST